MGTQRTESAELDGVLERPVVHVSGMAEPC